MDKIKRVRRRLVIELDEEIFWKIKEDAAASNINLRTLVSRLLIIHLQKKEVL